MAFAREVKATVDWEELLKAQEEIRARNERVPTLEELCAPPRDPPVQKMFGDDQKSWSEELKTRGNDAIKATLFNEDDVKETKEKCQWFLESVFVELDKREIESRKQNLTTEEEMQVMLSHKSFDRFRGPNGVQLFMKEGKAIMTKEIIWYKNHKLPLLSKMTFENAVKLGEISKEKYFLTLVTLYKQEFEEGEMKLAKFDTDEAFEAFLDDEVEKFHEKIDFQLLNVSDSFVRIYFGVVLNFLFLAEKS